MRQFQKFSKTLENSRCDLKQERFRVLPLWVAPSNYQLSSHQRYLFNLFLIDFCNYLSCYCLLWLNKLLDLFVRASAIWKNRF